MGRGRVKRREIGRQERGMGSGECERRKRGSNEHVMMHKPWATLTDLMLVTPMLLQKSLKTCQDK